ncbi:hypothetical protein LTR16_004804, partial [Cryomyces antarcticus]
MYAHSDIIREMQGHMKDLADVEDPRTEWLAGTSDEFKKLLNLIQEDLIKPIMNPSDVMYRSDGIRDTRQSLQLGTSKWRLSWITFIFLPLTFLPGFFGMNVSVIKDDPSIKWHFVSAVIIMLLVPFLWYFVKHSLAAQRQTPYERGIYEQIYNEFATQHPQLWSRSGPRDRVVPEGALSTLKWRLIKYWFAPNKTIHKKTLDSDPASDCGTLSRLERCLTVRWLRQIQTQPGTSITAAELGETGLGASLSTVTELLPMATSIALAQAEPTAATAMKYILSPPTRRPNRPASPKGSERPSSQGNSEIMVDEHEPSDDEASDGMRSPSLGID